VDLLSPAKLLVILVVALVVLGPDKLPKVARQLGSLWSDFRAFRERLESGVRETFPDLPSTETITQAVRSPVAFLDNLAETHAAEQSGTTLVSGGGSAEVTGDVVRTSTSSSQPAGEVRTEVYGSAAGGPSPDGDGVVHRVRTGGYHVPDDPGLN